MKRCPFCGLEFASRAKHAAKAHKGQTITFTLEPLDATYAIKTVDALERLSAMARLHAFGDDDHAYEWGLLLAVTELLLRDAKVNGAAA